MYLPFDLQFLGFIFWIIVSSSASVISNASFLVFKLTAACRTNYMQKQRDRSEWCDIPLHLEKDNLQAAACEIAIE